MIRFNPERGRQNAQQATTEDLLDRITVYRAGMEPDAIVVIEAELRARGVTAEQIESHAAQRSRSALPLPDGTMQRCSFCHRPAVAEGWGWQRLWGVLPVFPRYFYYCSEHRPAEHPRP